MVEITSVAYPVLVVPIVLVTVTGTVDEAVRVVRIVLVARIVL